MRAFGASGLGSGLGNELINVGINKNKNEDFWNLLFELAKISVVGRKNRKFIVSLRECYPKDLA